MTDDEKKAWDFHVEMGQKNKLPTVVGTFVRYTTILAADAELTALRAEVERLNAVLDERIHTDGCPRCKYRHANPADEGCIEGIELRRRAGKEG